MMLRSAMKMRPVVARRYFSQTKYALEIVTFPMADVGEGIKEVEVLDWFVKEGDRVEEFQKICEIQSDKATAEVTSRYTGVIKKIYTSIGDMQQVGSGLIDIDVEGSEESAAPTPTPAAAAPAAAAPVGKQVKTFPLADIGEGIKEVEILQWFVKEGDVVEEMDKLCEVQSDKATVELSTPFSGKILKVYHNVGDMQQVGQGLVDIEVEGVEEAPAASAPSTPTPAAALAAAPSTPSTPVGGFAQSSAGKKVLATPAVRRIAAEKKIDLTQVPATGKGGRVTKEDIINFMEGKTQAAPAASSSAAPTSAPTPVYSVEDKTVKISGRAKFMVASMTEALKIPSFGAHDEVNLNALVAARTALKPMVEKRGSKLSYMPFFIKASSMAMKHHPVINSQLDSEVSSITYKGAHNIGFAMDTEQGLVVPNIKNVESKSVFQIAEELVALQQRGLANKLTTEDLQGGTFTLSNIGSIGGTYVSPIIFAPQVAICGLGKVAKMPRYNQAGQIEEQNILYVSWSADHRVIDGATMLRFSNTWKSYLENPTSMLLDLI
eukprot:TRINITY_DN11375_c0_g1_i1.p1 TRINITY_DN11375_c0_g1~~TRINITY_DN11375_c0_g1_i1.p1  ORF type:complete len:549 (+),score=146.76 TRINITY_DN11375_c0_g1_i1:44-1690(+)